jgi:cell division ATPase FtsA
MTIPEMIKTLQKLQLAELETNHFYFYVEEVEEDQPTQLSKEEIDDVLESREQAKRGEFVPREEMKAFFTNAKKELQQAIEDQKNVH